MISASEAVVNTLEWFDRNSGWAPPDPDSLEEWLAEGMCRCPDECIVAPAVACPHGLASWWLILRCMDRPDHAPVIPPSLMAPHPDRLPPDRPDYVAVLDAHHGAVLAGDPGYMDPTTGLFVLSARTLWERNTCCNQGCRHCPYLRRSSS